MKNPSGQPSAGEASINATLQQAADFYRAGQLQKAESLYRDILRVQPDQADANHNLGVLAMQVGQPASGLPYLQRAWKADSDRERFCLSLTECLLKLDRSGEATLLINSAMQHKGFNSPQCIRMLQLASAIAGGERPSLSMDQELAAQFKAGFHAALEQRLGIFLGQFPNWAAGWDMLCTVRQIQGKDAESALQRALQLVPDDINAHSQRKIFCIGANKTGTTSVEKVFRSLGLIVGDQRQAEMLMHDWGRQDYRRIIRYCQSAEAYQDVPFSLHGTFQAMDQAFPASKFILTVRNNAGEWYESLIRFHSRIVGLGRVPTADDLRQYNYRYPGFLLDSFKLRYGEDESKLYNRDMYVQWYEEHISKAVEYFKNRPDDLLVLNVGEKDAMRRLLEFLGYPYAGQKMPHLNSSRTDWPDAAV